MGVGVCICVVNVRTCVGRYVHDVLFSPFQRREEEEHVKTMYVETLEQERQEAMKKEIEEVKRRKRYRQHLLSLFCIISGVNPAH